MQILQRLPAAARQNLVTANRGGEAAVEQRLWIVRRQRQRLVEELRRVRRNIAPRAHAQGFAQPQRGIRILAEPMRVIVGGDGIFRAVQCHVGAAEHQPALHVIGVIAHMLLELGDHRQNVGPRGRGRSGRGMPIPIRPQWVQSGGGADDQNRRDRAHNTAVSITQ